MELHKQIKKYRTKKQYSQEDLAEKIFVTRQSISNWESEKCYPDIHSLVLMAKEFDVTLDELIEGDIKIMKEEINMLNVRKFNRDSTIFAVLLIVSIVSFAPLWVYLKSTGLIIAAIIYLLAIVYAIKIEKQKKQNNMQTYKEIVAFMQGESLDEITKIREEGKAIYQKWYLALMFAIITLVIVVLGLRLLS